MAYQWKNKKGFSLIEILCVLCLVLFIAQLSISQAGFINRFIARSELLHLKQLVQRMRTHALSSHSEQALLLDPLTHTISWQQERYTLSHSLRFGIMPGIKGPPSDPTRLITHPITFPHHTISCSVDGTLNAGALYLYDEKTTTQYALTCGVSESSFVRLYCWQNERWKMVE